MTTNFPGGPSMQVAIGPSDPATAHAPLAFAVATGGTAVTVFAAGSFSNAGIITNPSTATESLFVDFVNTPGTAVPGVNGTTFELRAGQTITVPPLTNAVMVNAATSAHGFTAVSY